MLNLERPSGYFMFLFWGLLGSSCRFCTAKAQAATSCNPSPWETSERSLQDQDPEEGGATRRGGASALGREQAQNVFLEIRKRKRKEGKRKAKGEERNTERKE